MAGEWREAKDTERCGRKAPGRRQGACLDFDSFDGIVRELPPRMSAERHLFITNLSASTDHSVNKTKVSNRREQKKEEQKKRLSAHTDVTGHLGSPDKAETDEAEQG